MVKGVKERFVRGWMHGGGYGKDSVIAGAFQRAEETIQEIAPESVSYFAIGYIMAKEQRYTYGKAMRRTREQNGR